MNPNFIIENWEIISGAILTAAAFIGGRKLKDIEIKKASEEVKGNALDNISSNFKVYQELINDLESRFKSRIIELEEDLERMRLVSIDMRNAITDNENYIKQLKSKLSKYEDLENEQN